MDQSVMVMDGGGAVCRPGEKGQPSFAFEARLPELEQSSASASLLTDEVPADGSGAASPEADQDGRERRCRVAREMVADLRVALPSGDAATVPLRWDLVAAALAKGAVLTHDRLQADLQVHADRAAAWLDLAGSPEAIETQARYLVEAALAGAAEHGEPWLVDGAMGRDLGDALYRYEIMIGIIEPQDFEEAANLAVDRAGFPEMMKTTSAPDGATSAAWSEVDATAFVRTITGLPSEICAKFVEIRG